MCGIVGVLDPRRRVRAEDWERSAGRHVGADGPARAGRIRHLGGPTTGSAWANAASA